MELLGAGGLLAGLALDLAGDLVADAGELGLGAGLALARGAGLLDAAGGRGLALLGGGALAPGLGRDGAEDARLGVAGRAAGLCHCIYLFVVGLRMGLV